MVLFGWCRSSRAFIHPHAAYECMQRNIISPEAEVPKTEIDEPEPEPDLFWHRFQQYSTISWSYIKMLPSKSTISHILLLLTLRVPATSADKPKYHRLPSLQEQASIVDDWRQERLENIPQLLRKYGVDAWLVCFSLAISQKRLRF